MLRTVHLNGVLKQFSKKPVQVSGDTTQMVMQGLFCMFGPRFKQIIREGQWHLTRGKKLKELADADESIGEEELAFNLGKTTEIHLYPAVKAKGAIARIVVGAVLVVIGYFVPPLAPILYKAGAALILGGISEMLAPKPRTNQQQQSGQNASFLFNGTVNVTEQGGAVPIVYGRVRRASSLVLSAGISTENMQTPGMWGKNNQFKSGEIYDGIGKILDANSGGGGSGNNGGNNGGLNN